MSAVDSGSALRARPLPAERRHTIHFLRAARSASPVFLDTDVDMTWVLRHREQLRHNGEAAEPGAGRGAGLDSQPAGRGSGGGEPAVTVGTSVPSIVTYVVVAAGQVLARHPEANAAIGGRWNPRIVNYGSVDAKLVLDRTRNSQRLVASVPLRNVDRRTLDDVQRDVDRARDTPLEDLPELRGLLLLHRLPVWLGWPLFAAAVGNPRRRQALLGTFAVSSLGHQAVNGFHAVGGTALTFNLGRVRDTPVAQRPAADPLAIQGLGGPAGRKSRDRRSPLAFGLLDGGAATVTVAPVMRLNMAFDHRVLDGAAAAEVLTEVRDTLESGAGIGSVAGIGIVAGSESVAGSVSAGGSESAGEMGPAGELGLVGEPELVGEPGWTPEPSVPTGRP